MIDPNFVSQNSNLYELANWYEDSVNGINLLEETIKSAFHSLTLETQQKFFGVTQNKLREYFEGLRIELEISYILKVVARTEGLFRIDFKERAQTKKPKHLPDKKFKALWSQASGNHRNIRLKEDILDVWRKEVHHSSISSLSMFSELLKFRHWIAHGRYWPHQGRTFDLDESLRRSQQALIDCGLI